jgi:amino-acid N-acetyltransferase
MSTPTIRPALAADAVAIASLVRQSVPSAPRLPATAELVAERAIDFRVATLDGRVVGCVQLDERSPSLAVVRWLAVEDPHDGDGVDDALLDAIERLAGHREYAILAVVSSDEGLLLRHGFAPREVPELARERSAVDRSAGVYAKDLGGASARPARPEQPS